MAPNEPILLICHGLPPVRGIGGRRWAKFAKELARRGHPVHVIRNAGTAVDRTSLWTADVQHPLIHHHPLPQRYPTVMTKRPLTSFAEKVKYRLWSKLLPLAARGNWMDVTVFWKKQLLSTAGRLIHEHGIRQVIVSGAPFRLMAYAAELRRPFPQVRITLDFRDEWTWGGHYGLSSMGSGRVAAEKALEAAAVHGAHRLTSPHPAVLAHLQRAYPGSVARTHLLPHAVDPDDFDLSARRRPDGLFRMIYAGSMYGGPEAGQYFAQLLKAVRTLQDRSPEAFGKFRFDLYITGHGVQQNEEQVAALGWQDRIVFHQQVPPRKALGLIRDADLVVLFIPNMNKDILGTKFQEIFYAGTPILHVGEPGLVSRTIRDSRMGSSLRLDELATALPRIISGERKVTCDRQADHSAYLLPNVVERLVSEVLA